MDKTEELYSEEPAFENQPELLKKYYRPVSYRISKYLESLIGKKPYFGDLRVRIKNLETVWFAIKTPLGYLPVFPVGKVYGKFNSEKNDIELDPSLFPELDSPLRRTLRKYGVEIPDAKRVFGEELIHSVQKKQGAIRNYMNNYGERAVEYIEGAAAYISDKLFGETGIYKTYKEKFKRLAQQIGLRKAFAGA